MEDSLEKIAQFFVAYNHLSVFRIYAHNEMLLYLKKFEIHSSQRGIHFL